MPTASGIAAHLGGEKVEVLVCPRVESGFIFAVANTCKNWYDVSDNEVIDIPQNFRDRRYTLKD